MLSSLTVAAGDLTFLQRQERAGMLQQEQADDALGWAAFAGQHRSVQWLLHHGANANSVDQRGRTPAHWAALMGHRSTLQLLVRQGADALKCERGADGLTPLELAAAHGHLVVVQWLCGADAGLSEIQPQLLRQLHTRPVLCLAAAGGHVTVVAALLQLGVRIDAPDQAGTAARWHAALATTVAATVATARAPPPSAHPSCAPQRRRQRQ